MVALARCTEGWLTLECAVITEAYADVQGEDVLNQHVLSSHWGPMNQGAQRDQELRVVLVA